MTAAATAASRRVRRAARSNPLNALAMTMTLRWVIYRIRATVARDADANTAPWELQTRQERFEDCIRETSEVTLLGPRRSRIKHSPLGAFEFDR